MRQVKLISAALFLFSPFAANAVLIDFEADTAGPVANGYAAVGHPGVLFTDTQGADLEILDGGNQTDGQALVIFGDDTSQLQIDFAFNVSYLAMDFGNDDAAVMNAGDGAWLVGLLGGFFVDAAFVAANIDDIMNQTIEIAGVFDQAFFYYGTSPGDGGDAIGLIEAVDNINYEAAAVPEPGTLALLGLGLVGLAARRRRNV